MMTVIISCRSEQAEVCPAGGEGLLTLMLYGQRAKPPKVSQMTLL